MWLRSVRTSAPDRPSGRRFASTSQMVPSAVCAPHNRMVAAARVEAVRSASASSTPGPGSATKMTSTSLT